MTSLAMSIDLKIAPLNIPNPITNLATTWPCTTSVASQRLILFSRPDEIGIQPSGDTPLVAGDVWEPGEVEDAPLCIKGLAQVVTVSMPFLDTMRKLKPVAGNGSHSCRRRHYECNRTWLTEAQKSRPLGRRYK